VKQTETAALKKAGSNKSGPFVRQLSALYTKVREVEEYKRRWTECQHFTTIF
jgi:hypothetical protein